MWFNEEKDFFLSLDSSNQIVFWIEPLDPASMIHIIANRNFGSLGKYFLISQAIKLSNPFKIARNVGVMSMRQ